MWNARLVISHSLDLNFLSAHPPFIFFSSFHFIDNPPGIKNVSSALLVQPPSIYLLRTEEIEQLQFRLAIKPYKNMYTCTVFYTVGKSSAGNFECDR